MRVPGWEEETAPCGEQAACKAGACWADWVHASMCRCLKRGSTTRASGAVPKSHVQGLHCGVEEEEVVFNKQMGRVQYRWGESGGQGVRGVKGPEEAFFLPKFSSKSSKDA